jgi:hypothetical protein
VAEQTVVHWNLLKAFTFTNGPDVDRTVWQSPQWSPGYNPSFFGRTAIRNIPDYGKPTGCVPVSNSAAQLILGTWNPKDPTNQSFLGSQISTIEQWGLKNYPKGVAFEAQVVCPMTVPGGAVAAVFSYNLLSQNPFRHDEIDFEAASNYWSGSGEAINTNVYIASNSGIDKVVPTTMNFSQPVTFRIEWTRSGITWYANRSVIRTGTHVPQSDMSLTLNFWVPDSTWNWAYNANLLPSGSPGTNWVYQVNWARVYTIAG